MSCVTQSFYALMQAMLEVSYVIVNVAIFQICLKIFAHEYIFSKTHRVFPTIGMCMVYEKSKDLQRSTSNHHMYLREMTPHVVYKYCLVMPWLVVIFKHNSVNLRCLAVNVWALPKFFLARRKRFTLTQLELYQELKSSHIDKFYELN